MPERHLHVCIAVAVVMAGAMLGHGASAADAARPVSLVTEYAPLEKLAAAGDGTAARQLAADFRRCERVTSGLAAMREPLLAGQQRVPGFDEARAALEKDEAGLCAGYDKTWRDGRVYQVLWQAADAGDEDAAACYVATEYEFQRGKYEETDVPVYRDHVRQLLQRSIRKGQWRVVAAAFHAMTTTWVDNAPLSATIAGTPMQAYQLQRLLFLGASPDDDARAILGKADIDGAGQSLTPAQRVQAEQWAEQTFRRYYAASGPSTPERTACEGVPYRTNQL